MKKLERDGLLFLALLLASGLLFYFSLQSENLFKGEAESASINPKSVLVEARVNQHLKMTARSMELKEGEMRVQYESLPQVGDRLWPEVGIRGKRSDHGLDFSTDPSEDSIYQDLNRHPKEYSNIKSPQAIILGERAAQEDEERTRAEAKAEYVRQFIENARRHGYAIKVNDDMVITSVQALPGGAQSPSASGAQ